VYSIAEDREGNIWVGTNKGPVVYYDPSVIFDNEEFNGYQPEIPRNDGTQFVDLLLSTEKINAIAVDGANRKWFATEKSGVFLVSDDGKKEIHHFTEENSPLFSNNVQTLAVNDKTGEVYFGTDKGIVSYRGEATEGGDDFENVYVFPNPVRERIEFSCRSRKPTWLIFSGLQDLPSQGRCMSWKRKGSSGLKGGKSRC